MASLDLCVYGTPHGFDSYEAPPAMGEYYEQFYRTNRRGRMLMANRRNDGSTIYSFLVYDLIENDLRQHAFFGTSFTIGDKQYIPDLHSLYTLFNSIFDKRLANGRLFVAASGKLRYIVGKFNTVEEVVSDYLAEILSGLANFETEYYTADFLSNNSGQIALKNIDTPTNILTDTFKKSQWLAVSPYFKPDDPGIEVDLGDINRQYTTSLESLMQMSIHKHQSDIDKIVNIINSTNSSLQLMKKYAAQGTLDNDELHKINDLSVKLNTLRTNATALKSQIERDSSQATTITQHIDTDTTRHDGEQENSVHVNIPKKKFCPKCGREKPLSAFDKDSEICRECAFVPFWKKLDPPMVAIAAIILVIGFVSWILISSEKEPQPEPLPVPPTDSVEVDNMSGYAKALAAGNLDEALSYIGDSDIESLNEIGERFEKDARDKFLASEGNAESQLLYYLASQPRTTAKFRAMAESLKYTAKELDGIYSQLKAAKLSVKTKRDLKNKINKLDDIGDLQAKLIARVDEIPSQETAPQPPEGDATTKPNTTKIICCEVSSEGIIDGKELNVNNTTIPLKKKKTYTIESNQEIIIIDNLFKNAVSKPKANKVRIFSKTNASPQISIEGKIYTLQIN